MKNIVMSVGVVLVSFLYFACIMLPLLFLFFIPALPIMILAFPMQLLNAGEDRVHWTQKPYLWYFNNVWLKFLNLFGI